METIIKELKNYIKQNYEKPKRNFNIPFFSIKDIFQEDDEEFEESEYYNSEPSLKKENDNSNNFKKKENI